VHTQSGGPTERARATSTPPCARTGPTMSFVIGSPLGSTCTTMLRAPSEQLRCCTSVRGQRTRLPTYNLSRSQVTLPLQCRGVSLVARGTVEIDAGECSSTGRRPVVRHRCGRAYVRRGAVSSLALPPTYTNQPSPTNTTQATPRACFRPTSMREVVADPLSQSWVEWAHDTTRMLSAKKHAPSRR
jgi:hypothetical protein